MISLNELDEDRSLLTRLGRSDLIEAITALLAVRKDLLKERAYLQGENQNLRDERDTLVAALKPQPKVVQPPDIAAYLYGAEQVAEQDYAELHRMFDGAEAIPSREDEEDPG